MAKSETAYGVGTIGVDGFGVRQMSQSCFAGRACVSHMST